MSVTSSVTELLLQIGNNITVTGLVALAVTSYFHLVAEKKTVLRQRLYFELKSVSTAAATTDLSAFGSYALRYCRVY